MDALDQPYTTADEDPFSVQPYIPPNNTRRHRRSSMLDKWITEQQLHADVDVPPSDDDLFAPTHSCSSPTSPYLAYPELPRFSFERKPEPEDDFASILSYDLVDDDDIPHKTTVQDPLQQVPITPVSRSAHKSPRHSITPSFKTLNLSFSRAPKSSAPSSPSMEAAASRAFSRLSLFPRTPRSSTGPPSFVDTAISQQHTRSSSLGTIATSASNHLAATTNPRASAPAKWRPSVLGHFPQSSISQLSVGGSDIQCAPSRPSVSSGDTYTTWNTSRTTTTLESVAPTSPSKISVFESLRVRKRKSSKTLSKMFSASISSVQLSSPQTDGPNQNEHNSATLGKGKATQRIPLALKHQSSPNENHDDEDDLDPPPVYRFNKHEPNRSGIPYPSSSSLNRVKFSSLNSRTHRKKKKLIVSGVSVTETRKFEGIKRWCESFGDIRNISRMPNGDLQIDFRDPEVADTVCRIRAKVFIAGVGSVQVSWISGNKR
ncbi:hypothetical protein JR316_0000604 [Psilocybe cubensis]|uniref:Uncharacterized protein n=2 Tax=Psilocybe cubensis TaxID=181762 RepID=A0ACB8HFR2_PSICU|nr:hypothetical protein JR316_0000604 [Psilocybe cubensis]KAH9486539.1 hypothetical protein JR316_0000604 [Psilocybe cubensis]